MYDYLTSQSINEDSFFSLVPRVTYKVDNIIDIFNLDNRLLPTLYKNDDVDYAVTAEQAVLSNKINPYMIIAAYNI